MTAIYAGDSPPQSKIITFCLKLLSYNIRSLIIDGSYEEIVYGQNLGNIFLNKKDEVSKIINNQDSEEFKKQVFFRFIDSLYLADKVLQPQKLLPFLDSLIEKAYPDIKLTALLDWLREKLKDLGYSDTELNNMSIYGKR